MLCYVIPSFECTWNKSWNLNMEITPQNIAIITLGAFCNIDAFLGMINVVALMTTFEYVNYSELLFCAKLRCMPS